ncbi:dephospho-CoA kinase [Micromonosporaceae bacterium DT194]|uniref:dephospho-CoA kinase n=1 Tax=Melissospora conviva TaxID=3388432 RepID=UPI003C250182
MLMVGLTGGIGSGKSATTRRLAELGAVIVDADRIAREVVAVGTDGLAEIVETFGSGVLGPDGALDRAALGAVVFADDTARARLEAITHPRVRRRSAELVAAAPADAIVVNDVPLLVEVGLAATYHLVIVVQTDPAVRIERLIRDRGMTAGEANGRIRAQADDARRRAAADVLLRNDGTLADLHAAVDRLWRDRLVPYERNLREERAVRHSGPVLVPADPGWPAEYARIAARIRYALRPADVRLDHIGSTAVPGLDAKDVIDLQLAVGSLAEADEIAGRLAAAGFPRLPGDWSDDLAEGDPAGAGEKRLHGSADPGRPVHLHVRVAGSPGWRFALLMRDHLRADPERAASYLALKRHLAAAAPDMTGYLDGKGPWWAQERRLAQEWAARTGWRP